MSSPTRSAPAPLPPLSVCVQNDPLSLEPEVSDLICAHEIGEPTAFDVVYDGTGLLIDRERGALTK
jgi:hypothetical protein